MSTMEMGDSSLPVVPPAPLPVYAFYAGGNTPHVWTPAEIEQLTARWVLPIFVQDNPAASAADDANVIIGWLHARGWDHATTVAVDTESADMGAYLAELDSRITAAGFVLMDYQSKGAIEGNPLTSGGRWVADWTGVPHLYPGSRATQYATADMTGHPWDASVIDNSVALHELHPPAVHTIPYATMTAKVPVLSAGDRGAAVRRAQCLLLAWHPASLGESVADGIYGPDTAAAVDSFQRTYGITAGRGTVTAETWERLVTG